MSQNRISFFEVDIVCVGHVLKDAKTTLWNNNPPDLTFSTVRLRTVTCTRLFGTYAGKKCPMLSVFAVPFLTTPE